MTLKAILIDTASGKSLEIIDDVYGNPTLAVTDHYAGKTRFKSETRTGAGTSTIAEPVKDGAIMLTDMIISTDRVANSRLTVFFDDGVHNVPIFDGYANDAPINIASNFRGGWTGWKDAALKMTTVVGIKATVAVGYIKVPGGCCYTEWDALR
jgi:hypothetical protein